jgi:hypothetical protein
MPNTAKVQFNLKNFTPGVSDPKPAIFAVIGITKRGPVEQPELFVINSWAHFERVYGGLIDTTSDFPFLCKRVLSRGGQLRVCRPNATSVPAVKATAKSIMNGDGSPVALFSAQPKYHGSDYNNIKIQITDPSNGDTTNYWNMYITHDLEPDLNETYINLYKFVDGSASVQTNLDEVKSMSQLMDFTYLDTTTGTLMRPAVLAAANFTGGVNPSGHVAGDYTAAMQKFNNVDDCYIMAVPEMSTTAINQAGATYCNTRQDMVFFAHLANTLTTATTLVAERVSEGGNFPYWGIFGGGIRLRQERTLIEKAYSEMGDILGIAAYVHNNFGPWYSLAGWNRSKISDALGVVNNFGSPASFADLNTLANAQINMLVVKNGITQLSGNFSGQYAADQMKFLSVTFFTIWLKRTLKPILEQYLEEPNDIITFQAIYQHLKQILDKLSSPDYRAIYKYEYYGDQDAASIDYLQINDKVDVQNGKYKINLKVWPIPSMQELTFNLMLVQGEGVYIS